MNLTWLTNHLSDSLPIAKITKDTAIVRVMIYAENTTMADAHYLKAALDAIGHFTGKNITTSISMNAKKISENFNWLFWLSENDPPPAITKNNLFVYKIGKTLATFSSIITNQGIPLQPTDELRLQLCCMEK